MASAASLLVLLTPFLALPPSPQQPPECKGAPRVSLDQLQESLTKHPIVQVEGILAEFSSCPPCPEGAQCEACLAPDLVLKLVKRDGGASIVTISLEDYAAGLEIGATYRLWVSGQAFWGEARNRPPQLSEACGDLVLLSHAPSKR